MNVTAKQKPLDWKRILIVAVILGIAGYQWYTQNVQKAPAKNDGAVATKDDADQYAARLPAEFDSANKTNDGGLTFDKNLGLNENANRSSDRQSAAGGKGSASSNNASQKRSEPSKSTTADTTFLVSDGGRNRKSPAGLIYGMGGGGEHRVEHVMRHGEDDISRPSHGVFDGDEETILKLLDEAYEMVKNKSRYVKSESSQGNTAYTISMGRKIGYEGGQKGKRNGNRALKSVRLVLNGDRVITAYPYR